MSMGAAPAGPAGTGKTGKSPKLNVGLGWTYLMDLFDGLIWEFYLMDLFDGLIW